MPDLQFWICVVAAAMLVGLSKSGFAMSVGVLCVPLLALVMTARDAAGVLLPVLLVGDAAALVIYRRHFDRQLLWSTLPGCLIGTGFGWLLFASVTEGSVRLAIGLVTLAFVIDAWVPIRGKFSQRLAPSRAWGAIWGAIAGFTSFISHTGGPPFQIHAMRYGLSPAILAGTTTVFFAIVNAAKLVPYYSLGQLEATNLWLSAIMVPVALLSFAGGVLLVRRVSQRLFYHITYGLLFVLSLQLIWEGGRTLFQ